MGFNSNMHVFAILMKQKSAENVVEAYLSSLFTHKGCSIAILSIMEQNLNRLHSMRHMAYSASKEYSQACFTSKATWEESNMCTNSSREHLLNF